MSGFGPAALTVILAFILAYRQVPLVGKTVSNLQGGLLANMSRLLLSTRRCDSLCVMYECAHEPNCTRKTFNCGQRGPSVAVRITTTTRTALRILQPHRHLPQTMLFTATISTHKQVHPYQTFLQQHPNKQHRYGTPRTLISRHKGCFTRYTHGV